MTENRDKIRVLVVDDSAVMRLVLCQIIERAGFQVVGTAADGLQAIEQAQRTDPDVITLDVQMPGMSGIQAIEELQRRSRAAILMVSSLTKAGAELTLTALEKGAFDYIPKTNGLDEQFADELARKVKLASSFAKRRSARSNDRFTSRKGAKPRLDLPRVTFRRDPRNEVVVIGSSTGGPRVLAYILSRLPGDFPLGILVIQHMPPEFTPALAERLNQQSPLQVREAADGDTIMPGTVLVAPGGKQMLVRRDSAGSLPRIHLDGNSQYKQIFAPSVDVTMLSVTETYGGPCLGLVLTGMGHDGQKGMHAMKQKGWVTLVQDRQSCIVSGMVRSCLEIGAADAEIPLFLLPETIQQIVGGYAWA